MAFSRRASAVLVEPRIDMSKWEGYRKEASVVLDFQNRTASRVLGEYDPSRFLLSHATIVASVDVTSSPDPLGKHTLDGVEIHRKYSDYFITPETEDLINDNCFPPGTLITLGNGTTKKIEDIRVGDMVLTHMGRPRRVVETMARPFSGDLVSIRGLGSPKAVCSTANHPFFVVRSNLNCRSCGGPRKIHARTSKYLLDAGFCSRKCKNGSDFRFFENTPKEFVKSGDLSRSDYLTRPVVQGEIDSDLTPGKARLIGLFLAEGYYKLYGYNDNEPVGVCFAFSKNEEKTLAASVVNLLQTEFGVSSVIRSHSGDGGLHVDTNTNRELVKFFKSWVKGSSSKTKHLCDEAIHLPVPLQLEILKGWYEGDGCLHINSEIRLTGCSASFNLISQLQILLDRAKLPSYTQHRVTEGRTRLESGKVVYDPTRELESWTLSCGGAWLPSLVDGTYYEDRYLQFLEDHGSLQKGSKYRYLGDHALQLIQEVSSVPYRGLVYNFEVEEDHSYVAGGVAVHNCDSFERKLLLSTFKTFVGAESYVEHMQIPSLSKGKIIDAVARDVGKSIYIDILVANDLKHKPLIASIESGELNTLSMGAQVQFTICSICGNVAEDDSQICPHIRNFKGSKFKIKDGTERIAAELCGHYTVPESCRFIEASWVANPAFKGAVLRNILTAPQGTFKDKIDRAHKASTDKILADPLFWGKSASFCPSHVNVRVGSSTATTKTAEGDNEFDRMVEDLYQAVRDKTLDRLRKDLESAGAGASAPSTEDGGSPEGEDLPLDSTQVNPDDNETLIREAFVRPSWRKRARDVFSVFPQKVVAKKVLAGLILLSRHRSFQALSGRGFSGKDLLKISYYIDKCVKKETFSGLTQVYNTVLRVGGTSKFEDPLIYIAACEQHMGRKATQIEKEYLITRGKILSLSLTLLSLDQTQGPTNARSINLELSRNLEAGFGARCR